MDNQTQVLILFILVRNIIISGAIYYAIKFNYENKPKTKFFLKLYSKNKKSRWFLFKHRKVITLSWFLIMTTLSLYFIRDLL